MTMQKTLLALAAALAVLGPVSAQAQSNAAIDELREEIRKLRAEVEALKKAKPAEAKAGDNSGWGERIEQLELKQKDAVVAGDIGGGFRLPGSETSVKLYGYAEAHLIHDLREPSPDDLFTDLSFQPIKGSVPKGKTKLTASTSRFGFETSTPTGAGSFGTKLEMDFYSYSNANGNRNRLRLRHAYGEYAGWLVGQTWSTFMDVDDLPETVDFNGPIGSPFSRRTMVRYTWGDPKAGYKLTAALEDPEDQAGGGSANERLPQIVLRYDRSFDGGAFNLRLLGHEKRSGTQTKRGFGIGLGGNYKLSDKALLMGQVTRVNGDVDQLYGSNGYNIDSESGEITFDKNWGLVAGLAYTFDSQLRGNLVFGMNQGKTATGYSDNKSLRQFHANLIYSPIKNVELGAELIFGERKTFAGDKGSMSKFDLMGRYSF
jgi:Ni/Co efflux regulator RcnB